MDISFSIFLHTLKRQEKEGEALGNRWCDEKASTLIPGRFELKWLRACWIGIMPKDSLCTRWKYIGNEHVKGLKWFDASEIAIAA